MKITTKLVVAFAAAVTILIEVQSVQAQPFYPASVDVDSVSTNAAGTLVYQEFGNRQLIQAAASAAGITNLTGLSVVYNQTADALEVVSGTNNTLVSTPLAFATGVSLSNTNGTTIQRFGGVYWGSSLVASGSLVATEQTVPATATRPAQFFLQGQIQFVLPANGTNGPTIYLGNVSAQSPRTGNGRGGNEGHGGGH